MRTDILQHFVRTGRTPTLAELAALTGQSIEAAREQLHALATAHIVELQPGADAIWMAMPFSGIPTAFRVRADVHDGTAGGWWANCAWDALGIPAMLAGAGLTAAPSPLSVTTACPGCEQPIAVRVRADLALADAAVSVETPRTARSVVHVAVAAPHWWDDIGFT